MKIHDFSLFQCENFFESFIEENHPYQTIKLDHNWPAGIPDNKNIMYKIEAGTPCAKRAGKFSKEKSEFLETATALKSGQFFFIKTATNSEKMKINGWFQQAKKKCPNKVMTTRCADGGMKIYCLEETESSGQS